MDDDQKFEQLGEERQAASPDRAPAPCREQSHAQERSVDEKEEGGPPKGTPTPRLKSCKQQSGHDEGGRHPERAGYPGGVGQGGQHSRASLTSPDPTQGGGAKAEAP